MTTEPSQIGYILRVKNSHDERTYNLSFSEEGQNIVFKINEESKSTLITARVDKRNLEQFMWHFIFIRFDLVSNTLEMKINSERFIANNLNFPQGGATNIFFGKSEHIIDVPGFAIKCLTVKDQDKEFFFPLNSDRGNIVYDSRGKARGRVENPVWLINDSYYWADMKTFSSHKVAGSNFNQLTQQVYFFDRDSIRMFNLRTKENNAYAYKNPCPLDIRLGTNFLDEKENKLYVYEVFKNDTAKMTTIACLDLENLSWIKYDVPSMRQSHHHGGYFNPETKIYTMFGGFGNRKYSNEFISYKVGETDWMPKEVYTGDRITPRYFLSMGHSEKDGSLYIFGGMGNESGDQVVGRRYYYDLYKVDTKQHDIRKLWEIDWTNENMVPVRSMVVADDSVFYTLCYPEHFSNSTLQLYRFSIKDKSYRMLGDQIPIRSEKIKTNANIYYNPRYNELCAIVQEFNNDDIASRARIYTLSFPPIGRDELGVNHKFISIARIIKLALIIAALIAVAIILIAYYSRRRRLKNSREVVNEPDAEETDLYKTDRANAIYLFGEFTVRDSDNINISHLFSTQLRQVYALILSSSQENGISSQQLSDIMWPDRPGEKVKNSRGVTINHLRKLLVNMDGVQLIYEKGAFRIVTQAEFYCDYLDFMNIVAHKDAAQRRDRLIKVVSRGKFLRSIDLPQLDSFKQQVEHILEMTLTDTIRQCFDEEHYKTTIKLCEAVFDVDPASEIAISYIVWSMLKLKMQDEAKKRYFIFSSLYKKTMGEEFRKSFHELTSELPK